MDWYIDQPQHLSGLRHQFGEYLQRHATPNTPVDEAVLTLSELVSNSFQHGGGSVWVSVDWMSPAPVLTVRDLGPTYALDSTEHNPSAQVGGLGLILAAGLTKQLSTAARAFGGSQVTAELNVRRDTSNDIDPPRQSVGVLPDMTEAGPEGFGKESFLRALVVQLAQGAELREGPSAVEELVAQVGTDVGGQMEAEYRAAKGITDKLTPEQMAECFVRLKHAIDGDFYPIEVTEERIVLGNRHCPFGDAVKKAPALCRMTSSVFGGIAARNADGASVLLEERIAVGDPECRVVVYLGDPGSAAEEASRHRYLAPVED